MNIVVFALSFVLFIAGLVLMGYAFEVPGFELVMFGGGILVVGASIGIPAHVLKWAER